MRVGFDAQTLVSPPCGIGRYLYSLVDELQHFEDLHLVLFANRSLAPFPFNSERVRWVVYPAPYNFFTIQTVLPILIRRHRLDLFHAPGVWELPLICPCPSVVTIHDLKPLQFPEAFASRLLRWRYLAALISSVRQAKQIITGSENVKEDIIRLLSVDPDRVTIVRYGIKSIFHPYPSIAIEECCRRYGLGKQYFIYVGRFDKTKNVDVLLEAFHALLQGVGNFEGLGEIITNREGNTNRNDSLQLIIVGDDEKKFVQSTKVLASQLGIQGRVTFTGAIQDRDVALLMAGAIALVNPCEGPALPPLEAMACGTPVITAQVGPLVEILDTDPIWVPESRNSFLYAQAMAYLLKDSAFRYRMAALGIERAGHFSWHETAVKTTAIYRAVCTTD